MWFFIGVIVLILFILFLYFWGKRKFRDLSNKYLGGMSLKNIFEEARIQDEEVPKSLSSMDSIYLEQIRKDFPDVNINELKRSSEKEIINVYRAIENKDVSGITNGKIRSFVSSIIDDLGDKYITYDALTIHKTVISKYEKVGGVATIYFSTSFQYIEKDSNGNSKKVQDRVRCEYIYVIDVKKVDVSMKVLGINCPNCGSPITSLGEKHCSYCGSGIVDIIDKVWTINDLVRY